MRILMICASAPTRERPRAHGFVSTVSQAGHAITLVCVDGAGVALDDLAGRCERIVPVRHRARLAPAAEAELAAHSFNLIHLEGRAAALLHGPLGLPTVVDAGTCGTMRRERAARGADLLLRAARAVQIARARSCHTAALAHRARMIVATPDDAWAVRAYGATSQGPYIVPNLVDIERFAPPTSLRDQDTILLDLRGLDQIEAGVALRLARATMAQVWAQRAETRLMVIGRPPLGVAGSLAPDGRVEFTGSVSDPRGHLATATLALVPVTPCGSAPHAPLEAMATCAPVVGIPALARDLEANAGHDLLVASDPQGWARAALALLEDPPYRGRLGRAGRRLVELRHSRKAVGMALEHVYASATGSDLAEWRLEVGLERPRAVE